MPDAPTSQTRLLGTLPANVQLVPAPQSGIAAGNVLYGFKGLCPTLLNQSGPGCGGTVSAALDSLEAALCNLAANQGSGGGGSGGGVTLNCVTLGPYLRAGNCIAQQTGTPTFIAGFSSATGQMQFYPYTAPPAPYVLTCADLLPKLKSTVNGGCFPQDTAAASQVLAFSATGDPIIRQLPASTIPFIADCAGFVSKLKATANGGCLPQDSVSPTLVIAIDGSGNPIIRPVPAGSATTNVLSLGSSSPAGQVLTSTVNGVASTVTVPNRIICADLIDKLRSSAVGGCLPSDSVTATSVLAFDSAGNPIVRPVVAGTGGTGGTGTQFIPDCSGLLSRMRPTSTANGCFPTTTTPLQSVLGLDASGTPAFGPPPTPAASPIACADLLAKLKGTANGGCLPSDSITASTVIALDAAGSPVIRALPAPTPQITLTTNGTSGAATLTGNVLNIPNHPITPITSVTTTGVGTPATLIGGVLNIPAQFVADCTGFNSRLKSIANGGCITSDNFAATNALSFDTSGNPVIRPIVAPTTTNSISVGPAGGTSQTITSTVNGVSASAVMTLPTPTASIVCSDLLTKLKSLPNGGCIPTDGTNATQALSFDGSGNPVIRPIATTSATTNTLVAGTATSTSQTFTSTVNGVVSSATVNFPPPPASYPIVCSDLLAKLRSTTSGGCLPSDTTAPTTVLSFDAAGAPIIRPAPSGAGATTHTMSLGNSAFAASTTGAPPLTIASTVNGVTDTVSIPRESLVTFPATSTNAQAGAPALPSVTSTVGALGLGGTPLSVAWANTESSQVPADLTNDGLTFTVGHSAFYQITTGALVRYSTSALSNVPANATITTGLAVRVVRSGVTTFLRIGQASDNLSTTHGGITVGIDNFFSGSVGPLWFSAGDTIRVVAFTANVSNASAMAVTLSIPASSGGHISIREHQYQQIAAP